MPSNKQPVLSKLDTLTIEKGATSTFRWRWRTEGWRDRGYTGEYLMGHVSEVDIDNLEVIALFNNPDTGRDSIFVIPLLGNSTYHEGQWDLPGFIKKTNPTDRDPNHRCICGSETMYGKDTNLHTHWCKLYKPYK